MDVVVSTFPEVLRSRALGGLLGWQWIGVAGLFVGSMLLAALLERLLIGIGKRVTKLTALGWDDVFVLSAKGPLMVLLWGAMLHNGVAFLELSGDSVNIARIGTRSLLVLAFAWYLLRVLRRGTEHLRTGLLARKDDSARVNSLLTQVSLLKRVLEVAVYVVAAAILLMQFEVVRSVGVSLLASAGIAGLVIGLAAQKSIGTLLAGIQLTITQPIRMGDQVIFDNEFGTVEEITLSYVVLKLWDQRRLVVPINQFLEKTFQNWSKGPPQLLGVVFIQADFSVDVNAIRAEVTRLLEGPARHLWDGQVSVVQVTDVSDRTMTIRILASAATHQTFDLRCLLREQLVAFLRSHPEWLPRTRQESQGGQRMAAEQTGS